MIYISDGGDMNVSCILSVSKLTAVSSETNVICILSVNECQQCNDEEQLKNNIVNKVLGHVTKAAGIKVFLIPRKNESALAGTNRLVKDRSRIRINPRALGNYPRPSPHVADKQSHTVAPWPLLRYKVDNCRQNIHKKVEKDMIAHSK